LKIDVDFGYNQKFQTNFMNFYAALAGLSIIVSKLATAWVMHVSA